MTLEQLRSQLSMIEPNEGMYNGIDASDITHLEQLVQDTEAWMASRAVFTLSKLPDSLVLPILARAAGDAREEVRVAVASSIRNLSPESGDALLIKLLDDSSLGVRKFAVLSISAAHNPTILEQLQTIRTNDSVSAIRDLAQDKLRDLRL